MTTACRRIFGAVRGEQIHQFIEQQLGGSCPCLSGLKCPLIDNSGATPLVPQQRVSVPIEDCLAADSV